MPLLWARHPADMAFCIIRRPGSPPALGETASQRSVISALAWSPFRRVWGPRRVTAIRRAPPFVCLLRPGFAPIRPPFNTSEADFPIRPSFLRRNGFRLDSFQQRIDAGHGALYPLQPSACQRSLRHRSTVILPHRGLSWTRRNSDAVYLHVKSNEKFLGCVPVWTAFWQKPPNHDEWMVLFFSAATALSAQDITPHIISLVL